MIYTVTLNPSIDYHVWVPAFTEGMIHEAQKERTDAGGKGINVSKVLQALGTNSTALGFVGGFSGAFIRQQVEQAGIAHRLIPIEQNSRINIKMKAAVETDISGVSPDIPTAALERLLAQLDELTAADYLVLAGSVPQSVPADIYQQIMRRLRGKGVRVMLDAKGDALKNGLGEQPFLIKPNHHELGELFGVTITTAEEACLYGRQALAMGAQHAIVSMAAKGAVYVSPRAAYVATIPEQKPINSIGAGDSMVAGFLYAHTQGADEREAFSFAVAAGSATALSEGFCTQEKIKAYLPKMTITRMA